MWLRACAVDDLDDGEILRLPVDPPVAVFNVAGSFFATADTCTHAEASLADGYSENGIVECPLHLARFEIRTGRVLSLPATEGLRVFATKVVDRGVFVDVGDGANARIPEHWSTECR
jgi:nitrite reductase/ring-hydroxylating ferredoxin subunit